MSTDSFTANAPGTTDTAGTGMSTTSEICGEPATLPTHLVLRALRYAHRTDIGPDDIRDVRCTLQAHPVSDRHYAFIVETAPTTAAWTCWAHDATPHVVLVLPDCPVTHPEEDRVCSEYEGHPGGHTWQVEDPWNPRPTDET